MDAQTSRHQQTLSQFNTRSLNSYSKAIWMRSGWLRDSIYWVLLVSGWFSVSKTIIPEAQEHFLVSSGPRYTPSFGGLGLSHQSAKGEETRSATVRGKGMQQDNQPNHDRFLPHTEIDLEALRRDLEYAHAESDDYLAYELETRKESMAPTREEALAKLKELAPNAKKVYCDKIRMKVRRYKVSLPEDSHI